MSEPTHILLYESRDCAMQSLAERIESLDRVAVRVHGLEEARTAFDDRQGLIATAMLPTDLPEEEIKRVVQALRRIGPASGLSFILVGRTPDDEVRARLRKAGTRLALWEPFADSTLRFQLNRAIDHDEHEDLRKDDRVPTHLEARVSVNERLKDAVVYSLSTSGAYLETPRATMDGAFVQLEIRLPVGSITTRARVMFANVPGNLQRPNLPLGMGVQFEDMSPEVAQTLSAYIEARRSHLSV